MTAETWEANEETPTNTQLIDWRVKKCVGYSKAVFQGKLTALNAYIRKEEKSQINGLTFYLNKLKVKQMKPKVSREKKQ